MAKSKQCVNHKTSFINGFITRMVGFVYEFSYNKTPDAGRTNSDMSSTNKSFWTQNNKFLEFSKKKRNQFLTQNNKFLEFSKTLVLNFNDKSSQL